MNMVTPVTVETINNLQVDAGMLLKNFDFSSATDAESLMALIVSKEVQEASWMGATKGGINVQENRTYWSPEFDGKRMSYKGEKQFEKCEPKLTGTFMEYTPENVKAVSGVADIIVDGNVTTVQPKATIRLEDYFDNIVFVANKGKDGLYLTEMQNALCTSGMNPQSEDKNVGTLPFEFTAHAENVTFSEDLPIKYLFFSSSRNA